MRGEILIFICGVYVCFNVVAIVQEFGRNASHNSAVRYGLVYDSIGSDDGVLAHADTSEHDGAFADACMVAYCGNARVFGITPPLL